MEIELLTSAAAALVGFLVGLTGVGAGALMTPILILGFGVAAPVAIATDLVYATITKLVGGVTHMRAGVIQWRLLKRLWIGGVAGAVMGAGIVIAVVELEMDTSWLKYPLGVIIGLASISLFLRLRRKQKPVNPSTEVASNSWVAPAGGAGIGLAVSMTSVGAGALGMALLTRLSPRGTTPQSLVGTDLLLAVPIALTAGLGYLVTGLVDFSLLLSLLVGSIPGVVLGSAVSRKISGPLLSAVVATALMAAAVLVLLD
ncbi:MAG: hypothetical protein ABR66_05000 [Microbacteriaceae bacterium BACL25 MAG-120322-bin65]|nr:MAG: hypothetical protein ABR66_05000 [Microbacteriaceae bacterium BACL25 MAG-120322-bin65]